MFLSHLELPLFYVPPYQISRANWFRTMYILLINSHNVNGLSKTRPGVFKIVYILTILVGSFFSSFDITTAVFVSG